jgi:vaccinia related kinase
LNHLGVPLYIASGIHQEYRFLIMEHYQQDLQNVLDDNNKILKEDIAFNLIRQILYAYEFIHSKGYVHADLKASNVMIKKKTEFYLVNYGSCRRFERFGLHTQFTETDNDINGSLIYTSLDDHKGACML